MKFTKDNPLRVFTAFSGYDSQCMALDRIGIPYVLVGWSEIDKYAIQAHNAVYPQFADCNYGDISKINWEQVPDFDLFTYSFPCTDISLAGQQKGLAEGSGTRSSLLWECEKAIIAKSPKYLLMENVAALASQKFRPFFHRWINILEKYGYKSFSQIIDALNHNVPQHRERLFCVSIHETVGGVFYFPIPVTRTKNLIDVLETKVDEKYYLDDSFVEKMNEHKARNEAKGNGFGWKPSDGGGRNNASDFSVKIK